MFDERLNKKNLRENVGFCTHITSTLTHTNRETHVNYFHVNFPLTRIGHSSVVAALRQFGNPVIWNVSCPCFC